MEYIEVESQAMESDIAAMTDTLNQIISQIQALTSEMESLNGMWTGAGHSTYMNQFYSDCERMNEAGDVFSNFLERLNEAKKEYCQCEQKVADVIRTIHI